MCGTDDVAAHLFQHFHSLEIRTVRQRRSQTAKIMVDIAAAKLKRPAVQEKSFFRREFKPADAGERLA